MSILLYGGIARIGVVIRDVCTYKESMYFYSKKVSSPWAGAPGVVRDTIGLNGAVNLRYKQINNVTQFQPVLKQLLLQINKHQSHLHDLTPITYIRNFLHRLSHFRYSPTMHLSSELHAGQLSLLGLCRWAYPMYIIACISFCTIIHSIPHGEMNY